MANRFTDSQKWDDPWFRKLPCKYKAFWIFLLDKCNHAGVWKVDFESASFHIGDTIQEEEALLFFGERIHKYSDKWFVVKFIFFQYGVLSDINRVHQSVTEILQKEGLYKVYERSIEGCKNKDKDMDKDMDKEKKKRYGKYKHVLLKDEEYQKLSDKFKDETESMINNLDEGIELKGYKYKSHYLAILKWSEKDKEVGGPYRR